MYLIIITLTNLYLVNHLQSTRMESFRDIKTRITNNYESTIIIFQLNVNIIISESHC